MSGTIKNVLLGVAMIAVAVIAIMMVIKPNYEATQALNSEIATLEGRLAELQAKEADRAIYEAGIVRNNQQFEEILAKFPAGIEQENYLNFLGKMDEDKEIDQLSWDGLGFSENVNFYQLGGGVGVQSVDGATTDAATTQADATAATTQADAAAATTQADATATTQTDTATSDFDEEMVGVSTAVTVDYRGDYKGIKNMLAYIVGNEDRMTIDTMNITYATEEKELSGSFTLNLYAITSPSRRLEAPIVEGVDIGSKNIFDTNDSKDSKINKDITQNIEDGNNIISDYDYYVALNPSSSNADAIVIGAKADDASKISSNENEVQSATVKFFNIGEKFYVSYNIGDVSYPENFEQGTEFDPGDDLNLLIQSSKRKNDKDKSGVRLVIDNETSMTLNVKIDGDDVENPRVKIASRIGKVKVYE